MHARVARYRIDPDRCGDAIEAFRAAGAEIAAIDGFESGYVMVDPEEGNVMTVTLWESRAALDASEVRASGARQRATQATDGEAIDVGRYDLVEEIGR